MYYVGSSFSEIFGRTKKFDSALYLTVQYSTVIYFANISTKKKLFEKSFLSVNQANRWENPNKTLGIAPQSNHVGCVEDMKKVLCQFH